MSSVRLTMSRRYFWSKVKHFHAPKPVLVDGYNLVLIMEYAILAHDRSLLAIRHGRLVDDDMVSFSEI